MTIASSAAPRVYEVLELRSGCTRAVESTALLNRELTCASPPLASDRQTSERLGKPTALAVLSSDVISSSAYATEQIARMVAMLDAHILSDEAAMKSCLDMVATESEQVAWQALEKGTDALREGLDLFDSLENLESIGPVN